MSDRAGEERRGRGRPRQWANAAAKHQQYRAAQRERIQLVDDLLHAVRNAHWEEPEVQRQINDGNDAEVLRTLIAYYRQRYWMLRQERAK